MDLNFLSNSDFEFDFNHESSTLEDLAIPISILSHSDSHFNFDSSCKSSTLLRGIWFTTKIEIGMKIEMD